MPATTDQCRAFLVALVKAGVIVADWAWEDDDDPEAKRAEVYAALTNPDNWTRVWKHKPNSPNGYQFDTYEVTEVYLDRTECREEPATNFRCERKFNCDVKGPDALFDGQVAYLVLERPNGALVLGNYVGD